MVIVGGWAHRLLRYHPLAQVVPHDPLLTLDTDIAIPATLEASEQDLRGRLKASGFEEKFRNSLEKINLLPLTMSSQMSMGSFTPNF